MGRLKALLLALILPACWNLKAERPCELCRPPDDAITIEAGVVGVRTLSFSGSGCAQAWVASQLRPDGGDAPGGFVPDAGAYTIKGLSEGRCDVVLELDDGQTLRRTFELVVFECCGGLYATDSSRWTLGDPIDAR
jgi:hypothetical protein